MPSYINPVPAFPVTGRPARGDKYFGKNIPHDIRNRRRSVYDLMRRMGTPFLHKPRFNDLDFQNGAVDKSPVYDDIYEQTRARDPISHGVGYVSKDLSPDEWYDSNGNIVQSRTSPGAGWTQAPLYRGYGQGTLTYVIEPDRSTDFFKATTGGPIFKVQDAFAIAPWWPDIDDNDILIAVELDGSNNIVKTNERYEARNVNPVSMHGTGDRRGRRELGSTYGNVGSFPNTYLISQNFEMTLIPTTDAAYLIETDR